MKIQNVLILKESLQMLSDAYRAHSYRSSGEYQVTCLEGTEAAHILYYPCYGKYHIGRMSALNGVTVNIQTEMQILQVSYPVLWNPVTHYRRLVKTLAEFPRQTLLTEVVLHIACREINAQSNSIYVAVSKPGADALAQTVYPHHKLRLVIHPTQMVRQEKGTAVPQDRRVRLHENDRILRS